MMTDLLTPLAADFPTPDRSTWLKLVEKALKGADFEKRLVSRTADGLRIEPLYTRADAIAANDQAVPGAPPYVRGLHDKPEGLGWNIEQTVVAASPEAANKAALAELEGGASGVILRIAAPGQTGTPITSSEDMAKALSGIYLDAASVTLDAGLSAVAAAGHRGAT